MLNKAEDCIFQLFAKVQWSNFQQRTLEMSKQCRYFKESKSYFTHSIFISQQQFKNKIEEAPFNKKRNRLENALEVVQGEMKVFSKNVFELRNSFGLTMENEQNYQKLENMLSDLCLLSNKSSSG
ncbi:Hypothetical_protein [Hexamita inflata]|uniref:Hypothetical_protein n=1 Tax=Hexamita inflata TaxID=28002 RepID=A0AA86P784_9EUKA|nr:Hypothetical protein HINF_LOCUS20914 [Hexamita inflata]